MAHQIHLEDICYEKMKNFQYPERKEKLLISNIVPSVTVFCNFYGEPL